MIKAILFDLDGTLLPMDLEEFTKGYFGMLAAHMGEHGYSALRVIHGIKSGVVARVTNNGERTNEDRFWDAFSEALDKDVRGEEEYLEEFYREKFDYAKKYTDSLPDAKVVIDGLKSRGYRLILATNPIFPRIATEHRLAWAGLSVDDFELVTTYENSYYTKPNIAYYTSILEKVGLAPEDCLMVGNDVSEDMVAEKCGMSVFLMPRCLINKEGIDVGRYEQGSLADLLRYLDKISG